MGVGSWETGVGSWGDGEWGSGGVGEWGSGGREDGGKFTSYLLPLTSYLLPSPISHHPSTPYPARIAASNKRRQNRHWDV